MLIWDFLSKNNNKIIKIKRFLELIIQGMYFFFVSRHLHNCKSCLSEIMGFCQCAGAGRQNDPLGIILSF